ncbi:protein deadpan-like [Teleopsis dalmanni]|uniref:protein deadpan-like n=1 Tax=Teleopsis dalmanni TaxID=139649 RepID=UPI000D32B771|nr:protein deadpan-like [Teleopsis dalmanni]
MDYKNDLNSDDDFDCSNSYGGDNFNSNNNSNSSFNANGQSRTSNPNGLSKAELRKTNKPIMEKRRRARINHCLNELKSLILEAMKKDPARHTKLEKADILEMTVKHLQSVQRQQLNMAIQTDPTVIHKFKTGFVECAEEVNRYISQLDGVDVGVRQRLSNHLNSCATGLEQIGSMTNFNNGYRGQLGATNASGLFGAALSNPLTSNVNQQGGIFPPLPQDLNNNSNHATPIQMGGVQLIPSRLPSGEFALIMPNTNTNATNLLNNNTLSNLPFSNWPHASNTATTTTTSQLPVNAPQMNDIAKNYNRLSAFSKPQSQSQTQPQQVPQQLIQQSNQPKHSSLPTHPNMNKNINLFTSNHSTAFHQPQNNLHHNSTATTSPPLSPISSISSHGDDSIMHTSSEYINSRPATPPQDHNTSQIQQHNFSGVFNTPPSSTDTSLSHSRLSINLQQQQVTSTSGSGSELNISLKRSISEVADSSDSSDEPSTKKFANDTKKELVVSDEDRDSMWRPW